MHVLKIPVLILELDYEIIGTNFDIYATMFNYLQSLSTTIKLQVSSAIIHNCAFCQGQVGTRYITPHP